MPVYTYLFQLCVAGIQKIWTLQGILAYSKTHFPLPSLGRIWNRPGTLIGALILQDSTSFILADNTVALFRQRRLVFTQREFITLYGTIN